MSLMTLGEYEFEINPTSVSGIIEAKKVSSYILTYGGVCYFSWGMMAAGNPFTLNWEAMSVTMYNVLKGLVVADEPLYFNCQDGSGLKYMVELLDLDGKLFFKLASGYRRKVYLDCLIMEEGVAV